MAKEPATRKRSGPPAGPKTAKGPAKRADPTKASARRATAKEPAPKPASANRVQKAAAAKDAKPSKPASSPRTPVEKTRVVFPKDVYEPRKDEIKAPFKAAGLKWNYLGEGKGLYKKEGVNVFAHFLDDGTHYSLWGDDKATVTEILAKWETLLGRSFIQEAKAAGEAAKKAEASAQESEALRAWKLQEPQRRPGEPDLFFKKRTDEWLAKKPA